MKAIAIDCAITQMTIAAKNDSQTVTGVYNIGMKQSETILPALEYVTEKACLSVSDLDYLAITQGPGSFTGLRLGFSALKAIEMSTGAPLYGISTLDAYSYAYKNLPFTILCAVDAKKERFYAKAYENGSIIFEEGDWNVEQIVQNLEKQPSKSDIIICGSDSELLFSQIEKKIADRKIYALPFTIKTTDSLFAIAEEKIKNNEEPLKDFSAPVYIRASEAEIKVGQNL